MTYEVYHTVLLSDYALYRVALHGHCGLLLYILFPDGVWQRH
jgi:hypothetical protein